jgi:hypothetical protein
VEYNRFLVVGLIQSLAFSSVAFSEERAGQAVNVTGRVLVRNEDQSKPTLTVLKSGDTITQGTVLNTSSIGNAKLLMSDKTVLDLGPSTLFKVKEYQLKKGEDRTVEMSMGYGKIRASVNSPVGPRGKFTIKTRSATMGVRGTEFVISAGLGATVKSAEKAISMAGQTQITVIKGKVDVLTTPLAGEAKKAESIRLVEGNQLTTVAHDVIRDPSAASGGEAPKIVKLSIDELKIVQKEAKQEDRTFVQAISIDPSEAKGNGLATLQTLASQLTLPADFIPRVESMGLPGTFGSDLGLRDRNRNLIIGAPITIKVKFQ